MPRPSPSRSDRLARGGISWVTALLLAIVAGAGYAAWTYGPVYLVHYEVKQVVREHMNQAVRDPNDAELVANMVHKIRVLDTQPQVDERGNLVDAPTVPLEEGDVTWTRDTGSTPPTLRVQFDYTRQVEYPLLHRWTEMTLSVDMTTALTRPDWGPAR